MTISTAGLTYYRRVNSLHDPCIRKSPEARKGKADAERAYPEWIPPARSLSRSMTIMSFLAVIITLVIATLAAYIYFGNSRIANIADINAQIQSLDQEINPAKRLRPSIEHARRGRALL